MGPAFQVTKLGPYISEERAIARAKLERDDWGHFEGWAEDFYEDNPPPYCSGDGENYDDDEVVRIRITTTSAVQKALSDEVTRSVKRARCHI